MLLVVDGRIGSVGRVVAGVRAVAKVEQGAGEDVTGHGGGKETAVEVAVGPLAQKNTRLPDSFGIIQENVYFCI